MWLLLSATALITPAVAGDVACASPQTLSIGIGPTNGCTYIDNNFVNFNVSAATGSGDGRWPAVDHGLAPEIEFSASGMGPLSLDFTTTGQTSSQNSKCAGSSWCVAASNEAASQSFSYDAQTTGKFFGLILTDGTVPGNTLKAGDVITTEEQFCLGSASFNCTTGSSNYGYVEIKETSNSSGGYTTLFTLCTPGASGCAVSHPTAASISFASTQTQIGIENTIAISTAPGETKTVYIDSFNDDFMDAPEPSTFVLFGTALGGLCLLGYRRHRGSLAS
jgi:hypothetical protein